MATIRNDILSKIRDELVGGDFEAGQPLRETELAKRFGVSRGPIRDAFLQLSQEGFLTYQANRGVTVRHPPDQEDRAFLASLRSQIEVFIVNKGFDQMSPDGIARLQECLKALHEACVAGDIVETAKADMEFHRVFLVECNGEEHLQVWRQLCSRMLLAYKRLCTYEEAYSEHVEIVEGFKRQSKEDVIAAIRKNVS